MVYRMVLDPVVVAMLHVIERTFALWVAPFGENVTAATRALMVYVAETATALSDQLDLYPMARIVYVTGEVPVLVKVVEVPTVPLL
jgi:hypothetical protein